MTNEVILMSHGLIQNFFRHKAMAHYDQRSNFNEPWPYGERNFEFGSNDLR